MMFLALLSTHGLLFSGQSISSGLQFDRGITSLMRAARDGETEVFKKALKWTSDINDKDEYGWTALTYATVHGDQRMVKSLLSRHADVNIVDEDGRSILMHAIDYNYNSLAELLIKNKADLNQRDKKGATALGLAWAKSNDKMVALLEKAGATKLTVEDKRAEIYSDPPLFNGPILLNAPTSMSPMALPVLYSGTRRLKMRVLVGADGNVRKVRVLIGMPNGITAAGEEIVLSSKFHPAKKDGQPVEAWTNSEMSFRSSRPIR
jgi:ankyrin repeat protein